MSQLQTTPVTPRAAEAPAAPRPLTSAELGAIRESRSELSSQLTSATRRRGELVKELEGTDGLVRNGLEARIRVLDDRIVALEQDIAQSGRTLTENITFASTAVEPSPISGLSQDNFTVLAGLTIVFVLTPISLALARVLWRRARTSPPPRNQESDSRLERIEQAVDAIAIEVERISEAQRFSAKLLSQGPAAELASARGRSVLEGYAAERGAAG